MSMRMSSSRTTPSKAFFPLTGLRYEVALLETVWDLDETLAVSTDRPLLDLVSMGIPLVDLRSSPP